jgi:hypothetical protein
MTFLTLIPSPTFDVARYGAKGDGTTDDSSAIAAALSAANSAGGGTVRFSSGTYIASGLTLYANVHIRGAGINATTIKLKTGTNTDLFSAQTGSISLSAVFGVGSAGTLYNFGLYDVTLDGNKANQTSGPSYPLRFYGYGYIFQNLRVKNGYSGGVLSDWNGGSNSPGQDAMDAQWSNVKVHDCNGIGIQIGGPHDSQFSQVQSYSNGSHCFHIAPNATGTIMNNAHAWGPTTGVSAVCYLIETGLCHFTNCLAEGSDYVNVYLLGNQCSWIGGIIFGAGVYSCSGVQIGQQAGLTPVPSSLNQSAGVTTAVGVAGFQMNTLFSRNEGTNGSIYFANDSGNMIIAQVYLTTGTAMGGSIGNSMVWTRVNGITADGTRGKGGALLVNANANQAFTIRNKDTSNDIFNVNSNASPMSISTVNGTVLQGYSDNYTTLKYTFNADGAGSIVSKGSFTVGPSASAAATATSGTVTTTSIGQARIAPTGNITGVILQAGTAGGQIVEVINESAFLVTFAVSGTSNVSGGTGDVIGPNTHQLYAWDAGTSLWYRIGSIPGQPLALYDGELGSTSGAALTANSAYFTGVYVPVPVLLTGLRLRFTAGGAGNCQLGIYNSAGTRLYTSGNIATASGVFTHTLSTSQVLSPGAYWLAFWIDNATDTPGRVTPVAGAAVCQSVAAGAGGLPSTMASVVNAAIKIGVVGLISGGWS